MLIAIQKRKLEVSILRLIQMKNCIVSKPSHFIIEVAQPWVNFHSVYLREPVPQGQEKFRRNHQLLFRPDSVEHPLAQFPKTHRGRSLIQFYRTGIELQQNQASHIANEN